jgi:beta-fructofuranosidase
MVNELYDPTPMLATDDKNNKPLNNKNKSWKGDGELALDYSSVESNALYIDVNVTGLNPTKITGQSTLNISFTSPSSGETIRSGFYFGGDQPFFVDRGLVRGFDNVFFTDKFSVADVWNTTGGTWRFQAVIDRSMYEVFVDSGVHAGTVTFFPTQPLTLLSLKSASMPKDVQFSVDVWAIKSAWKAAENEHGTVVGNTTKIGRRYYSE